MNQAISIDALRRFDASQGPRKVGPEEGEYVDLGALGVRFMIWGEESGAGFSLVEHPIPPRSLCAPLHRHSREDEYSFVLEGTMGAQLGDDVIYAEAGDLAFKPRDQWHTFWNAGDEPCRILEIIAPAGFEHFFRELGELPEPHSGGDGGGPRALRARDGHGEHPAALRRARAHAPAARDVRERLGPAQPVARRRERRAAQQRKPTLAVEARLSASPAHSAISWQAPLRLRRMAVA